ncbi:MAG: non-canonical purine NTP pyrophosphatase [Planctomycetota bacterium]
MEIWIATGNPGKATEARRQLRRLMGAEAPRISTLAELPGSVPADSEVIEDAPDFHGNAHKKAEAARIRLEHLGHRDPTLVLAEDSGLCVDALGGAPGTASARYAGPGASDADRIAKLLAELEGCSDRRARFVCSLVVLHVDGREFLAAEQSCEGYILEQPIGANGFGYDPVFAPSALPEGLGIPARPLSFACLTAEEKDRVSHRGKALEVLARRILGRDTHEA